jgi:hypothetical protein
MDYKTSGNPKQGKHEPKNRETGEKAKKPPRPGRPDKEELLARLKEAAKTKKAE